MKALVLLLGLIGLCLSWSTGWAAAPQRVVSLMPSSTEILFALGLDREIVGVTIYCNYPAAAQRKEKVGDFANPNIEKIVALRPDIVFAGQWQTSKIAPRLRALGLHVVEVSLPGTVEDICQTIELIARHVGREPAAQTLVRQMRERIDKVRAQAARLKHHPRVYVEIDLPSWTVSKGSFVHSIVELCGGENIFADIGRPGAQVSREEIIKRNPEIIISMEEKRDKLAQRPGWKHIAAIKNGNVIDDIERGLLTRPGPSIVEGIEVLFNRIAAFDRSHP